MIGLDYGRYTVGVAVSDATGTIASAREIIRRDAENKLRPTFRRLEELVSETGAELIVLGLPLHLDGCMSERAKITLSFGEKLHARLGLPVVMQDERLTSVEAEELLRMRGIPKREWKASIDSIAAEIILQDYLNGKTILYSGAGTGAG